MAIIKTGTVLADRFELVKNLGHGAMGEVWSARDRGLMRRDVAIKLMKVAPDADLVKRFMREARVASELENPHVLRVFDLGEQDGQLFIVMELLHGKDLQQEISGRALPVDRAVDLAIQLADGLATVHAANIVHRDLKPANVFIKSSGTLKICDFGIARDNDEGQPFYDSVVGTPIYIGPERWGPRNRRVEPPSDLWAVGCILYEMLTGRHPFASDAAELPDLIRRIASHDPAPPRELNRQVPASVNDIVLRLLAKDPSKRPVASQLKTALEDARRSLGAAAQLRREAGSQLEANGELRRGMFLTSPDGRFTLVLQESDGNFVLYGPGGHDLWASGRAADHVVMQGDGNLVGYSGSGDASWASDTVGSGGIRLVVQDDGNVVIYSATQAVWSRHDPLHLM